MTASVPNATSFSYTGDGETTEFSFPLRFLESAEVLVYLDRTLQTVGTHYSITGAGTANGGTVTFVTAPDDDAAVVLRRSTDPKQTVNLTDTGRTPGDTLEGQLDRLAMVGQDHDGRLGVLEEVAEDLEAAVSDAEDSATAAATSATAAATSATAAATAKTAAETAQTAAEEALAELNEKYLGAYADDAAATAAAGGSPIMGAEYWSTSENRRKTWDGSAWSATDAALSDGSVTRTKLAQGAVGSASVGESFIHSSSPFGRSGIRILRGEKFDAHYGWGGILNFASGKWVMIYRKAADHATTDGAEVRAIDSTDKGCTWTNDRLLYSDAAHDARPDPPRIMASNRGGFFVNRADEGSTHFSPLFFKTDDEGVTFTSEEQTTVSPYTFQASGGIMDYPTSQGGDDTLGFVAFGFLDSGGMDAFTTVDNGDTWVKVSEVANIAGTITALSENMGIRVGDQDKWIIFSRTQDAAGWRDLLTVFVTTDLLDWGTPLDAGVDLGGNPPGVLYDPDTNKLHLLSFGRGGRDIDGFDHHLLHIEADADDLYDASGSFSALGLDYSVLATIPNWATGYIAPFQVDGQWWATFTCAEPGTAGGNCAVEALIGDFLPTGAEQSKWNDLFLRRQREVRSIGMHADDNETTTHPFTIENASRTGALELGVYQFVAPTDYTFDISGTVTFDFTKALLGTTAAYASDAYLHIAVAGSTKGALTTEVASSTSRTHWYIRNLNGVVGSVSTSASATTFATTSDEEFKDFIGAYDPLKAIEIIRADPVRDFTWKTDGAYAVGWGAQTSFAVSPDLAAPGGWFDPVTDQSVPDGTPGALYVPWGVDQGKRTPYLWAAVSWLLDERDALLARIEALEGRLSG